MLKIIGAGLAVFVLLLAFVALGYEKSAVEAGDPDCFDGADGADGDGLIDTFTPPAGPDPECVGVTPTPASATPTVAPSATATATAAPTTTTAASPGTATATARVATVTPAAVPGTGGEPNNGPSLLLLLAIGAGVVAGTAGLAGALTVTRRS